jgi:transcriptional regulator with XRE-family HTH domain
MTYNEKRELMEQLDWSQPTRLLAAQTGLPKRTISYYRKELGKGRAVKYAPQDKPANRKMKLLVHEIDWSKPRKEIAEQCGVSLQRISQLWNRMNQCSIEIESQEAL